MIRTLYTIAKLNSTIVLTGHGKATTVTSVTRYADLFSSIWKQVKVDHENDKKTNKTLLTIKAKLEPKYNPLYKIFTSEIE